MATHPRIREAGFPDQPLRRRKGFVRWVRETGCPPETVAIIEERMAAVRRYVYATLRERYGWST